MVRSLGLHEEHVQAGLVGGELFGQLAQREVLGGLDDPQVEDFGLHYEVVGIADLLLDLSNLLAGEARHDAVNECGAHVAVFREPCLELLIVGAEIIFPQLNVLINALLQVVSVQEDQLARHDDKTLRLVALEGLEAAVEQLGQLAWIGRGRRVGKLAIRVESNAGFGRVGDDEADFRLVGQGHEGGVLRIGVQGAADAVYARQGVHSLAVQASLQIDVIEAVLAVEPFYHTLLDGLHDYDTAVEVGLLVHVVDDPVYKRAEEVTFAKLDDSFGCCALGSRQLVQCFHIQCIF